MERIWRWCAMAAFTVTLALVATLLAPATTEAQSADDDDRPRVACIHVFHTTREPCTEQTRLDAVADMVAALESYAGANGSYWVAGGGYHGRGSGWAYWEEAGSTYSVAIATVLSEQGHLAADATRDPLWYSSTDIAGDLLVYRCRDRVAVFTRHSSLGPSENDYEWWTSNGCTTYPIERLNATYFHVSMPLSQATADSEAELVRLEAVADMVAALESYAAENGTYRVDGGGYHGGGTGWAYWEEAGSTYPVAVATVLSEQGHLAADATRDPLWYSSTDIAGDLLVYRCQGRAAVFTPHSTTETSPTDRDWWAENGCTRYPIERLNATYFELATRLPVDS